MPELFENGLKIGYHYDRLNRPTECIYPDGSSVKQAYNPIFLNKAERIKNDVVVYEASFDKFDLSGKPEKVVFPKNSGTLSLKYDKLNRPKRLSSHSYKEKDILYDSRGLLISKIVNDDLQEFDHDHLQQLTLEKTSAYSHTYENDALNRQTSVDGLTQTHNAVHQLTQGVHSKYIFDTKGRRTSDSSKIFTYNKFDQLIKIRQDDSTWSYTYDAFHRKMSRTFSGTTVYYLYDGHEEIGSYDSELNNLDLKVLFAGEGSLPIAIELGKQNYSPLLSSQGHIVGLVEMDTGKLADRSYLTMFGEDLASNPLSPWRFCGKRHETSELGLIDFGFRFYHPKSAQWLTQDPIGETDGPNLYAYVGNSPTYCIDRFGLFMDNVDFSTSWSNLKNSYSWAEGQVADYSWIDNQIDNQVVDFGDTSFLLDQSDTLGSLALDCTPVIGSIKSAGEFLVGQDLVTGEETSRWIALAGVIPYGKLLTKAGKGANKIANVSEKVSRTFKARKFTEGNFRKNLKRYTGISPGKDQHAHHVYPKEFAEGFAERGINVHDPKHGVWWEATEHWEAHGKFNYNKVWRQHLDRQPPFNQDELLEIGRNMMGEYGKKVNF